jgi:hypothetical protein
VKRGKFSNDPMVKAVKAHGFSNVMRSLTFAAAWCIAAEYLGHEPTLAEYREWWNEKERVTYKDQAAFRKVTGLQDPSAIYRAAKDGGFDLDKSAGAEATGLGLIPYMRWAA